MVISSNDVMEQETGSQIFADDDLRLFETRETSSITRGSKHVHEKTLEELPVSSNTKEDKQVASLDSRSIIFQGGEKWPLASSTKRGRKMVLVAVFDDETEKCPSRQYESKSVPTSPLPLPPFSHSVVSEESFDHLRDAFKTPPNPKSSSISRRSYSDSHNPARIPESPRRHCGTVSFDTHLWKRTKLVPATANHRSLSWSSDEEEPVSIASPPKRAMSTGSCRTTKATNPGVPVTDCLVQANGYDDRFPLSKLQSKQGKWNPLHPFVKNSARNHHSVVSKQATKPEHVDDIPRQLAQAVHTMRISQIEGYSEIYRAMQFSPTILTHASVFCKTFQFFRHKGIPCKVDIGYRYFVNEKEYVPETGLLPGICTFNDPFAFYPHEHTENVQGQLVARLAGNLFTATTTLSQLKGLEAATYTAVEMPLWRSIVQTLSSPDQCLPLLHFDSHVVLDLYDNESMGNLILHTYHQRLQRELDQLFNDGIMTKVPFHLPSEHPDFQPFS